MKGLMQDVPLTMELILRRALRDSAAREVVERPRLPVDLGRDG